MKRPTVCLLLCCLAVCGSEAGKKDAVAKRPDVNAAVAEPIVTLQGHTQLVWSVAFSPDGKQIVSGSGDATVKVWDAETGQESLTLKGHTSDVNSVSFSPDGKRIVSGSFDRTVKVWDLPSLESPGSHVLSPTVP